MLHSTASAIRRAASSWRISAACAAYGVITAIDAAPARTASCASSAVRSADTRLIRELPRAERSQVDGVSTTTTARPGNGARAAIASTSPPGAWTSRPP